VIAPALALVLAAAPSGAAEAVVRSLFPEADAVEVRDLVLTDEVAARLEALARARVRDRLLSFYTARRAGAVAGYAAIQSHVVRTKRETLAVAFEPDGRIRRLSIVAFLEPPEYRPPERWLRQFDGKGPADRLAVGDDLLPITGATLSARGIAEQARLLLAALRELARERTP
jgi:hypothetical protein